ncbi:MAG: curli-like amyloid fiber formation chaperone CsgH [Hyphomonadaceae bacterium]|nr:curli-like amyloid fiber formation chaperone CsgH [Hyphomonadaceae bacterium]
MTNQPRHLAILLAATAIAACSSPQSAVDPAPAIASIGLAPLAPEPAAPTPLAADRPVVEPAPELALAPEVAPAPLTKPLPAPAPLRQARATTCDVVVERTRNGVLLTALARVDRPAAGDYSFVITKSGGGNSSDINQGGPFKGGGGKSVELGASEISLERGSSYRATLTLTSQDGREICRRTVRS